MAGPMVGPLLERLADRAASRTTPSPTATFPDHEPNPLLEENRQFIIDKVREHGADIGIALDGDADRCFFIDDRGDFVDGDFITAMLAEHAAAQSRARRSSTTFARQPRRRRHRRGAGGTRHRQPRRARVHQAAHARRRARSSLARSSGHYYFRDFHGVDTGIVPALLLLQLLSVESAALSDLVGTPREVLHLRRDQLDRRRRAEASCRSSRSGSPTRGSPTLDGVSVDYDDWHFNVRPSNTEPLLRLNLESLVSREDMERRRDEVLGIIRS